MAPFIVLVVVFNVCFGLGKAGVPGLADWTVALRIALAAMFALGASAHWGKRRADLVRMVPTALPNAGLIVTLTGVAELAGAAGLLVPPFVRAAAIGLSLLLLAMFPANVHAARAKLTLGGRPATPLGRRTALQVVFLAATVAIALRG
jgi:uncharacterized membrane protein